VAVINLVEVCTCSALSSEFEPIDKRSLFCDLDDNVIIWVKIEKVKEDSRIKMEWYNPSRVMVFSIDLSLKKTPSSRPFRYFWGFMELKLLNFLECEKYGVWSFIVKPFNLKKEFRIVNSVCYDYSKKFIKTNFISIRR